MHTRICDLFGIEFPIFAFSHCRDVVVGGEQGRRLRGAGCRRLHARAARDRAQVDRRAHRRPSVRRRHRHPGEVRGHGRAGPEEARTAAAARWSRRSIASSRDKILADHGVPKLPEGEHTGQPTARLDGGDRHAAGRDGAQAPQGQADRQCARHPAGRRDRRDPRHRPPGRGPVRTCEAGAPAQGGRRRHHRRPGRRGRRAHRRDRQRRAVACK